MPAHPIVTAAMNSGAVANIVWRRLDDARESKIHDRLAGCIVVATAMLLIANSVALYDAFTHPYNEQVQRATQLTLVAFILNVALLMLGWRRYRRMKRQIQSYAVAEKHAAKLAVTDPLTGFYNRRALKELTDDLISNCAEEDRAVAFMLIDVDDFKQINDIQGHSAGDYLLSEFASRVRPIAPRRAYLARIGGDEFAFAFAYNRQVPQEAIRFAEAVIRETRRPFVREGVHIDASVSIGLVRHEGEKILCDDLMRRADLAMYEAKRSGKNNICLFDEEMEHALRERLDLQDAIRQGIEGNEFVPHFEPLVDMKSGDIVGFEMLTRWNNPDWQDVPPERFIGLAQNAGLIDQLSFKIIEKAFIEARDWDSSLSLSINISPMQLLDENLAQTILKLLIATGFPAERLEVEVTESAMFKNIELARTVILNLKNQGIRVAYDDFGTGYSSLTHLRELPFDRIKVDRRFVGSVIEDENCAALVRAIAALCGSLNIPMTAEGIENKAICEFIAATGDMVGQGYHFGRPLSLIETRRLLAARNLLPSRRNSRDLHRPEPDALRPLDMPTMAGAIQG